MVARYQTCYTNLTEGSIHESIWKNQQPPTVFLHDAKNHKYRIAVRHYAHYRSITNKLIFFQKVLVFYAIFQAKSDLFCLVVFCSASAQTVLTQTVGITLVANQQPKFFVSCFLFPHAPNNGHT